MARRIIASVERDAIVAAWNYKCAYCRTEQTKFEIDHIKPYSKGGSCDLSNLAPACSKCNATKSSLELPDEYKGILLAKAAVKKDRIEGLIKSAYSKRNKPKPSSSDSKRSKFHCIPIPHSCSLFYADWDYIGPVELYDPNEKVLQYLRLINLNIKVQEVKREVLSNTYSVYTATLPLSSIGIEDYALRKVSFNKRLANGWGLDCCTVIKKYTKDDATISLQVGEDFNYVYEVMEANAKH